MGKGGGDMNKDRFYELYLPAVIKAINLEKADSEFNVLGPEHFLEGSEDEILELELYIDNNSGKDKLLDSIGYYFDAISHNFKEIDGVLIKDYKKKLMESIKNYKSNY